MCALDSIIRVTCGSSNTWNCDLDYSQFPPFILRAESLEYCQHRHWLTALQSNYSIRTRQPAFAWKLADRQSFLCSCYFSEPSSITHTPAHTHCRSIKIPHNWAPQHTWSPSVSMPDLPWFPSPWAVQHTRFTAFWLFHGYHKSFCKVSTESCQLH